MFTVKNIFQRKNTRWATMIELMAVLAIMWLWITALLSTIWAWIDFAKDTENNIKAINIAREWIEWVINIRDTNWLRFSSDKINCWNTYNYSSNCIGWWWTTIASGSYILYSQNGVWNLTGATWDYVGNWIVYKTNFKVGLDSEWFYTQSGVQTWTGCNSSATTNCITIFSREIQISLPSSTGSMNVSSIVRWKDKRNHSVILNTLLTNWKSNF